MTLQKTQTAIQKTLSASYLVLTRFGLLFGAITLLQLMQLWAWAIPSASAASISGEQIQAVEVRTFIHQVEGFANDRHIDRMIEAFAADAQIGISSLEGDRVVLDRASYYLNLQTVFLAYQGYANRMTIDSLKIENGLQAIVQGTTYEKINFSDQPINGISNWTATIAKQEGKLVFKTVEAYLSRAQQKF
jgi:hypothetical protein